MRRLPSADSAADRGQATPLWAIVILLAGLLLIPAGKLISATVQRAEAQTAADASALAGALAAPGGEAEARAIAGENGARLIRYTEEGNEVEVTVQSGDFRATARAEREIVRSPVSRPG